MRTRSPLINLLLLIVGLLFAGFIVSLMLSFVGHLLWLMIRLLIPILLVIWLIRKLTNRQSKRSYF